MDFQLGILHLTTHKIQKGKMEGVNFKNKLKYFKFKKFII